MRKGGFDPDPDVVEAIGEDPRRYLLVDAGRDQLGDDPLLFAKSRIEGIDRLDVLDYWLDAEVEVGPRKKVIAWINRRKDELEEIGERPDRLEPRQQTEEPTPEPEAPEETEWIHEPCGSVAEQESSRTWFCPECEQRTNRVEQRVVDGPAAPAAVATDGGEVSS